MAEMTTEEFEKEVSDAEERLDTLAGSSHNLARNMSDFLRGKEHLLTPEKMALLMRKISSVLNTQYPNPKL